VASVFSFYEEKARPIFLNENLRVYLGGFIDLHQVSVMTKEEVVYTEINVRRPLGEDIPKSDYLIDIR